MKKFIFFILILIKSNVLFCQTPIVERKYKIMNGSDCAIGFGKIQISKPINKKFRFRIDVNNDKGYEGYVGGYATYTSSNKAIYKGKDCGSITFTFLPNNIIQVKENDCMQRHGANICFDGKYQEYK